MAVTEVIRFRIEAQLVTRQRFLTRIRTEPACGITSLSYSASMFPTTWSHPLVLVPNQCTARDEG